MSPSAFLVITLLLAGCCQFSLANTKCAKNQLKATIVFVDENALTVKYKIENTDKSKEVCALKWNTMMDNDYWASAVEVWLDTGIKGIPYSKPVIPLRQSEAKDTDYQHFGKGQSIEFTRDLSTQFSFKDNKKYWIQVETKINDCYKTTTPNTCTPREAKHQTELEYKRTGDASTEKHFAAKATKNAPQQTFAQWLATKSPSETYTSGGSTIFAVIGSITRLEYTKLKNAHDNSKLYLSESIDYLKDKRKAKALYEEWFGTVSTDNYKQVQQFFGETKNGINQPYVYNMLPKKLCGKDILAHVDSTLKGKEQHVVNVCPLFFTSSCSDRLVTLIHEMTHDSAATDDEKYNGIVAYGEDNAKDLAADDPDKAINNAENYALFAEQVHKKLISLKRKGGSGSCSSTRPTKRTKPLRHLIMNALLTKLMQLMLVVE